MAERPVLIVDDDPNILYAFQKTFESIGMRTLTAADGLEAVELVEKERPGVVFMDVSMPRLDGLAALKQIKVARPETPVIIITGQGNMDTAIQAMQSGAYDYLTKPVDIDKVRIIGQRAMELLEMRLHISDLEHQLDSRPARGTTIVGQSAAMQEVYKRIGAISATPNTANVLVLGETGTGKELAAQVIHEKGPHPHAPFIAINCTALPESLLESELFGHEKGAFTGADRRKMGKFEVAGEGTVFLDEIGDVSEAIQQKLLRVTQERTFQRLGGHELLPLIARLIVATHRDLAARVESGDFREDLFYRLNVMEVILPPLRERPDDIPPLIDHFVAKCSERFGVPARVVSPDVIDKLKRYGFPGNVRQLENMIGRAMAMERSDLLTLASFPTEIHSATSEKPLDVPIPDTDYATARQMVLHAFEKRFAIEQLTCTNGNVSEAARRAGIERQSFQRLMKKHDISSGDFRGGKT